MQMIQSKRLYLKAIDLSDAQYYLDLEQNTQVMKYIERPVACTLDEAVKSIEKIMEFARNNKGLNQWVIIKKENNEKIGNFVLRYLENTTNIELGYRILPNYWGNGYVKEIGLEVIKYASEELKAKKIVAITDPANIVSQKVLQKLGFQKVGNFTTNGKNCDLFEWESGNIIN